MPLYEDSSKAYMLQLNGNHTKL